MHWQYYPKVVTCGARTTATAPQTDAWQLVQGQLKQFRINIPAGHNGRTGLRLVYMGTEIVPWNLNSWLIGSGEVFTIPWADEIMATGLSVQTYNLDSVAHSFWLYAEVLPQLTAAAASPLEGMFTRPHTSAHHRKIRQLHGGRVPVR
jgi:hypothetical protein